MRRKGRAARSALRWMVLLGAAALASGCGGAVSRHGQPALTVSATEITFTISNGSHPCPVPAQILTITNQWINPVAWDISGTPGWLLVSPQRGELSPREEVVAELSLDCQGGIAPETAMLFVTAVDTHTGAVGGVARVTVKKL